MSVHLKPTTLSQHGSYVSTGEEQVARGSPCPSNYNAIWNMSRVHWTIYCYWQFAVQFKLNRSQVMQSCNIAVAERQVILTDVTNQNLGSLMVTDLDCQTSAKVHRSNKPMNSLTPCPFQSCPCSTSYTTYNRTYPFCDPHAVNCSHCRPRVGYHWRWCRKGNTINNKQRVLFSLCIISSSMVSLASMRNYLWK